MRTLYAAHVGVDTRRLPNDKISCTRCGIVKVFNRTRRNKDGEIVVKDRRTYRCTDCLQVEADLERGPTMRRLAVAMIALAALVLTGCSMPSTQADEVYVHKGSGITEGHDDKGCVPQADRQINWGQGWGDDYYAYPASQRVFDFRGAKDSDRGPFDVVSKDGQTLQVPGTMSFLLNIDCKTLQKFHDRIGNRDHAYMDDNQTGAGWVKVLNLYMAPPLDATLDRVAKKYTWRQLRSDLSIKDEMNTEVAATIATLIDNLTEGDEHFFTAYAPLVLQPIAPPDLVKTETDREAAIAQAATAQAKAEADAAAAKAAADAQVKQKEAELAVARIEADKQRVLIQSYGGPEAYAKWQAIQKGINPWQPSYGNSIVNP